MKVLAIIFTAFLSMSIAFANQDILTQKLELQKKFISNINQCNNPTQLDQFIKNAIKSSSDQEKRAKYAWSLEELMKYNPGCFVATINMIDHETCEKFEETYFNEPSFYPKEDLRASLASAKNFKASCFAS